MSQKNIYILRQINVVTHLPDLSGVFEKALLISLDIRQYILALDLFLLFLIEAQLIYNVVPIPTVQQSDSFVHICTFFFLFFSIMVYHRILNIVCHILGPCCLSILNIIVCIYQLQTPSPSLSLPSPLATTSLFFMSMSLFLFCIQVHLCHILFFFICAIFQISHMSGVIWCLSFFF